MPIYCSARIHWYEPNRLRLLHAMVASKKFNAALEKMTRERPSLARTHTNRATRHGAQTGSFSVYPAPEMRILLNLINGGIRAAQAKLHSDGLGNHP